MDEELMAYVSGDLQASPENSWVWTGSETGMNIAGSSGAAKIGASPTLLGGGREEGMRSLCIPGMGLGAGEAWATAVRRGGGTKG